MKIYPDTKIFILCLANTRTGGPESLHQLASQLISFGVDAYMFYAALANQNFDKANPVDDAYKKYHVPYTFDFVDAPHNVIIIPETATEVGFRLAKKSRRVIWWMGVENFLVNIMNLIEDHLKNPLAEPVPKFFYFDRSDVEHWGQSEYVRQFLRLNGVKKIHSVETHMSQIFLSRARDVDFAAKKNIVAYNPRKGFELTKHFIKFSPDLDWQPIENMTPAEVQALLARAKVYVDFGHFPGRERLPREAVLSGCVIIVGKRGAAINDVDINIPAEFKFDLSDTTPNQVIEKIREVFDDFEIAYAAQKNFRDKELNAQKNFAAQVAAAFEIKKFPPPSVALVQGVGEESFVLAEKFFGGKKFAPKFIVDEVLAEAKISDTLLLREQNRNYLRIGKNFVEIITQADAKFLYLEGRIKKFALLNPTDDELAALKNFYAPNDDDVLIFD